MKVDLYFGPLHHNGFISASQTITDQRHRKIGKAICDKEVNPETGSIEIDGFPRWYFSYNRLTHVLIAESQDAEIKITRLVGLRKRGYVVKWVSGSSVCNFCCPDATYSRVRISDPSLDITFVPNDPISSNLFRIVRCWLTLGLINFDIVCSSNKQEIPQDLLVLGILLRFPMNRGSFIT